MTTSQLMFLPATRLLTVSLCALTAGAFAQRTSSPAPRAAVEAIVAAERAFAQAALMQGTKAAFLATMADSAIVFSQAQPALAHTVWSARPAPTAAEPALHWGPAVAGAAASGELGYSTGPWFIQTPEGKRVAYGQFFTIWARQPDGRYRWLLDNGISHPLPAVVEPPAQVVYPAAGVVSKVAAPAATALDEQLTADATAQGLPGAYAARLHPQARLLREGALPLTTAEAIRQQLSAEAPRRFLPAGGRVARSGELAYTYGTYQNTDAAAARGSYVHLWQRGKTGWQLLAEVFNPAP
ncbi:hypothetical protein [Hymenobacter sp. CRA2]|uniref:hypothetical protein n=1 Tax=Hymenobacter sp. CRA2 TaxID=1955620 RepID=UPI00098E97AD|nr:hypothetical protein [Hymenobacter sp. CRA2]OON67106.1 hypothetical protein B0919_19965 [Hymenobacter sp. CRA2]